jgi:hypothetical protein
LARAAKALATAGAWSCWTSWPTQRAVPYLGYGGLHRQAAGGWAVRSAGLAFKRDCQQQLTVCGDQDRAERLVPSGSSRSPARRAAPTGRSRTLAAISPSSPGSDLRALHGLRRVTEDDAESEQDHAQIVCDRLRRSPSSCHMAPTIAGQRRGSGRARRGFAPAHPSAPERQRYQACPAGRDPQRTATLALLILDDVKRPPVRLPGAADIVGAPEECRQQGPGCSGDYAFA